MTVVGDERIDLLLDHRVAALLNVDAWRGDEARRLPIQTACAFGQCAEYVNLCDGGGDALQGLNVVLQLLEQLLVQVFFARQRPLFGGQRFVLKSFEFGRDVAFGAFERLAALVFGG